MTMKEIMLIYETDAWHSRSSNQLVAIATTEKKRDKLIKQLLKEDCNKITRSEINQALKEIREHGQTQSLSENYDIEIIVENWTTNIIC